MPGPRSRHVTGLWLFLAVLFLHRPSGTSTAANQWRTLPVNVDQAKWRVWDWSDPQFLRGLR